MKRILAMVFALVLLLPSLAFADVIVEPDNSFYRTHKEECQHREGRTYLADGPDGSLNLYTAPGGTVSETLQNGAAFYCQWTYTDKQGIVWGFSEGHGAWVPLGYTMVQYDHIAFREEHADKITTPTNTMTMECKSVYLYEYPGAPNPLQMGNLDLTAEQLYTDEQGRQWGYVSYVYGIRNKWFCLDDPANDQLSGEKKAAVPSGYEAPEELPTVSNRGVIAAVVGGVALVTLAVVLLLFRRKKAA